jgi:hypothetical protein
MNEYGLLMTMESKKKKVLGRRINFTSCTQMPFAVNEALRTKNCELFLSAENNKLNIFGH